MPSPRSCASCTRGPECLRRRRRATSTRKAHDLYTPLACVVLALASCPTPLSGAGAPHPGCHGGAWPAKGDATYTARFKEHFAGTKGKVATLEKYLAQRQYARFNTPLVARLASVADG